MTNLLSSIDRANEYARSSLMDALRVAESWVVGHEVFHVCLLAQASGPFPELVATAEANRDVLEYASLFCNEVTRALKLPGRTAKMWLEEFQADLLARKALCIAIGDRRFMLRADARATGEDARFHAARACVVILNAEPTPMDGLADAVLSGAIGDVLPQVVNGSSMRTA